MRPPLLPVGSVFSSSALAWITSDVPLSPSSVTGLRLRVKALVVPPMPPSPEAAITRFGRSPTCGPAGFSRPCCLPVGVRCAAAEGDSGGSQGAPRGAGCPRAGGVRSPARGRDAGGLAGPPRVGGPPVAAGGQPVAGHRDPHALRGLD